MDPGEAFLRRLFDISEQEGGEGYVIVLGADRSRAHMMQIILLQDIPMSEVLDDELPLFLGSDAIKCSRVDEPIPKRVFLLRKQGWNGRPPYTRVPGPQVRGHIQPRIRRP